MLSLPHLREVAPRFSLNYVPSRDEPSPPFDSSPALPEIKLLPTPSLVKFSDKLWSEGVETDESPASTHATLRESTILHFNSGSPTDPYFLPQLPCELAFECLLRFPLRSLLQLRSVDTHWRNSLLSREVFLARREKSRAEKWIFVATQSSFDEFGRIQFLAFDATSNAWHLAPPMPTSLPSPFTPPSPLSLQSRSSSSFFTSFSSSVRVPSFSIQSEELKAKEIALPREGFCSASVEGRLFVLGGVVTRPVTRFYSHSAESEKPSLPHSFRSEMQCSQEGEEWSARQEISSQLRVFDPISGEWNLASSMREPRAFFSCAVVTTTKGEKRIVVSGGRGDKGFLSSAEYYDVDNDKWHLLPALQSARVEHQSLCVDGRVWVMGGEVERSVRDGDAGGREEGGEGEGERVIRAEGLRERRRMRGGLGGAEGGDEIESPLPFVLRSSVEVLDEERGIWHVIRNAWPDPCKLSCPCTELEGKVFVAYEGKLVCLDPRAMRWSTCGDLPPSFFSAQQRGTASGGATMRCYHFLAPYPAPQTAAGALVGASLTSSSSVAPRRAFGLASIDGKVVVFAGCKGERDSNCSVLDNTVSNGIHSAHNYTPSYVPLQDLSSAFVCSDPCGGLREAEREREMMREKGREGGVFRFYKPRGVERILHWEETRNMGVFGSGRVLAHCVLEL